MARIAIIRGDKCFCCHARNKKLTLQKFWITRKGKPIQVDRRVCGDCQQLYTREAKS